MVLGRIKLNRGFGENIFGIWITRQLKDVASSSLKRGKMSHRSTGREEENKFLFGIWSDDIIKSGLEKTKPPVHKEAIYSCIYFYSNNDRRLFV